MISTSKRKMFARNRKYQAINHINEKENGAFFKINESVCVELFLFFLRLQFEMLFLIIVSGGKISF